MNLESISQLGLTFFGLTPDTASKIRAALFKHIHEICFHGQGGYSWETVYSMPTWLRRFTFKNIQDFHNEENKKMKSQTKEGEKTLVDATGKINTPNFKQASKNYKKPSSYK
jgi:hypothetical protein